MPAIIAMCFILCFKQFVVCSVKGTQICLSPIKGHVFYPKFFVDSRMNIM